MHFSTIGRLSTHIRRAIDWHTRRCINVNFTPTQARPFTHVRRCDHSFESGDIDRCKGFRPAWVLTHLKPSRSRVALRGRMVAAIKDVQPLQLDRTAFQRMMPLTALSVPKRECHKYMKLLKRIVFAHPKLKAVIADDDTDRRQILLKEELSEQGKTAGKSSLPPEVAEGLNNGTIQESIHNLKLDYSLLSCDAVLKELLPAGWEVPSSFETVGHIAHLNLREEYEPYKHIIGQVILDKNSAIRTVVNKVGILENTFRVLPLEIIAGEDQMVTTVKQHSTRFVLNYAEVYWNSRLEEEHTRLVSTFKPGEVIVDVMAGIGPFAIPAAQQGNEVYANDLNPRSYYYLQENIKLNKVSAQTHASEMDGREFIRYMAGSRGDISHEGKGIVFHHAIMNLPASAVEFLDAFCGSFDRSLWQGKLLPLVHVYTFAQTCETDEGIKERIESHLGGSIEEDLSIRLVRDVAPKKRMMRVTFRVPHSVAFNHNTSFQDDTAERDRKRFKADCVSE